MFWDGTRWTDGSTLAPSPRSASRRLRDFLATIPILVLVPALLIPVLAVGARSFTPSLATSDGVAPGGSLMVSGTGFPSREWVELRLDGTPSGTTVRTDNRNSFSAQVNVPNSAAVGSHELAAFTLGKNGKSTASFLASAVFQVGVTPAPTLTPPPTPAATPTPTLTPPPTLVPSPAPSPTPTTGPNILSVTATNVAGTSATITWTVSTAATGQVEYGLTTAYGTLSTPELTYIWSTHIQALSGLTPGTTYHYRVKSSTLSGANLVSGDYTFTTTGTAVSPSPTPTPAPTPTATPSGTRPFAAPVTSRTVTVPTGIDSTGATNAAPALQSFINSTPDGSIIVFKAGGVYRLDRGLFVSNRHNLVFDGNGSTLRAAGSATLIASSPFLIDGGNSDIVVKNFTIEGNNPKTGTAIFGGGEDQQGVAIYGGTRIEITNNTVRKTFGDGVYANEKDTTHSWVDGLWVHDNTFAYIGRMGLTMNGAKNALLERNSFDQVGMFVLDIEPDTSYQGATDIVFRSNTAGVWGLTPTYTNWFVAAANNNAGPGAVIRNITITDNYVSSGAPTSANTPNFGGLATWIGKSRTSNIVFTNNTTSRAGAGAVLRFEHVDGLTVRGNVQPLTSGSLTYIFDSTNVSQ
jgi:hypothetical protein